MRPVHVATRFYPLNGYAPSWQVNEVALMFNSMRKEIESEGPYCWQLLHFTTERRGDSTDLHLTAIILLFTLHRQPSEKFRRVTFQMRRPRQEGGMGRGGLFRFVDTE
jgi:hypothetical protein